MKIAVTFIQGFSLAALMCALVFGVVVFRSHYPTLMTYLDRDHLPMSALAVGGVCLAFATVWTLLAGLRAKA